jgi:hypothetical protein
MTKNTKTNARRSINLHETNESRRSAGLAVSGKAYTNKKAVYIPHHIPYRLKTARSVGFGCAS